MKFKKICCSKQTEMLSMHYLMKCSQCIIWWKSLGKWYQLFYWNIECSFNLSYHITRYFFFQWLHIEIDWVFEGITSESAKVQNVLIKEPELKKSPCCNLWLGSLFRHGMLCPMASSGKTLNTNSAGGQVMALHVPCTVDSLSSRDIFGFFF